MWTKNKLNKIKKLENSFMQKLALEGESLPNIVNPFKDWFCLIPSDKKTDRLITLIAYSFPNLSDAISEMQSPSSCKKHNLFLQTLVAWLFSCSIIHSEQLCDLCLKCCEKV